MREERCGVLVGDEGEGVMDEGEQMSYEEREVREQY